MKFEEEIQRRRTFAIISHPDAGKTTLTEKLLLFGGAIHTAGAVKNNKIRKTATSDFMEIEKQRGISVATSVMGFEYKDKKGKYRNYTPDFVIKKKDGKVLIVEVKAEQCREQLKEMALEEVEKMNEDKIKYELLLTDKDELKFGEFEKVKQWVYDKAK